MNRGVRILQRAIILLVIGITAQAQPALVKEISNESISFTRAGDFVYFVAGSGLYRTDGSAAGTILLRDGLDLLTYRRQLVESNGLLFFTSNWTNTTNYQEIWRSDGTPEGTYMLSYKSNVEILGSGGDYLYFRASEGGTGSEIYRTDGTVSGTLLLKDINPGPPSGAGNLLKTVGNLTFFSANDGVHGIELWKTDGSSSGTVMVKDINAGPADGIGQAIPALFNNKLYFSGITSAEGAEPWVSDGTSDGTILLRDLVPGSDYPGFIEFTTDHDGWLYFFSSPVKDFGTEEIVVDLWKTDGSSASTQKLKSLERCISCTYVEDYRVYKDKLYFFLHESWGEEILWSTDGTESGTTEVFSMPSFGTLPFFEELNGHLLFFSASGSIATPFYRSDGTASGTEIFHTFKSAGTDGTSNIEELPIVRIGDLIYFSDHDGPANNGYAEDQDDQLQLMRSDGHVVQSIRSIAGGSYPGSQNLVSLDGQLIFTTTNIPPYPNPRETRLWTFDPAAPIQSRGTFTLINADTDVELRTLNEGDVITRFAESNFNIRYNPPTPVGSVVFKHQNKVVRRENAAPYSIGGDNNGNYLVWSGAVPGDHKVEAIPYSGANGTGTSGPSLVVNFSIATSSTVCNSSGSIVREYWGGVSGNTVSSIPVNTEPHATSQLTVFEGPSDTGTNYGSRIRGYICIPQSGAYTFWIASNDHSELWLSSDANPANKQRIAYVTGSTNPRQWDKFPSQQSTPVQLTAGQRYYIEALHKQGVGTDHIAVGWQLPNGYTERPISGSRLSPFSGQLTPMVAITSPREGQVFQESPTITISGTIGGFRRGSGTTVELYAGSLPIGLTRYNTDTFTFEWKDVRSGAYPLKAIATDLEGRTATSEVVNIVVEGSCTAVGRIGREYWNGIQGTAVSDIPLEQAPSGSNELSAFEIQGAGTNFGARIRGYLCPPASGEYTFWIASNDHSELWISSDDDPANKQRIAYANGATGFRQWNKFASQRSAPVSLTQGKRYYIEALHKQGIGTDHISVGWQLPDGTQERPIGGSRLSPFGEENDGNSLLLSPASGTSGIDPLVVKLEVRRVIGAERYTIELSPDAHFSGDIVTISSIEDFQSELIIKNLASGTTYHARVKTNESGYGPVTTFRTREMISRLRLWGITTSGGGDLGSVFSYSINDNTFTKHYIQQPVSDGYDGFYEQRLMGTLVPGPDGVAYGHSDHDYSAGVFTLLEDGTVKEWMTGAYFNEGKLFLASNNIIYATNDDELGPGVIDKYSVTEESLLLDERMEFFQQRSNGSNPGSPLIELSDGYLYGTARSGGINEGGVIFRVSPSGREYHVIHYFNEVGEGMNPASGLTEYNGFLYGTTRHGGEGGNRGTVFRIRSDGSQFMKLHDFNGFNGAYPQAELVIANDVIYGTTKEGGDSDEGVVFRIGINGSGFSKLHDFSGLDGAKPARGLVRDRDGNFYGMTTEGGANHSGVIYRINDTGFLKLFDFSTSTGGAPNGALLLREDTYMGSPAIAASTSSIVTLSVSIHPNPSTDNFNIMVSSPASEAIQLVITDQYGQQVATHRITPDSPAQIGEDLRRGVYIMKVIQGKEITMQRIVKK